MDAISSLGIVCVGGGIVFSSATKWRGERRNRSERGRRVGEGENEVKEASEKWGAGTRMRAGKSRECANEGVEVGATPSQRIGKCADAYASPFTPHSSPARKQIPLHASAVH